MFLARRLESFKESSIFSFGCFDIDSHVVFRIFYTVNNETYSFLGGQSTFGPNISEKFNIVRVFDYRSIKI